MKFLTIALLACVVFAAFAEEPEYDAEAFAKLDKIEKSKFGETLLDTIQLQLEAGDPVDDLILLLRKMEKQVNDDQAAADAEIKKKQDECDADISKLENEIAASKKRIRELKDLLDAKIPERQKRQNERVDQVKFKELIEGKIADLEREKQQKDEQWKNEQEQHDKATFAIQSAKEIIKNAVQAQGNSFLQQKTLPQKTFIQLSNHFAENAKKQQFVRKSWNSILNILAQITASAPIQANQSAVGKIIQLCDEILDRIAKSREVERQNYQNFVDTYSRVKSEFNGILDEVNRKISELDQQITSLTRLINQSQQEKQEQEERARQKKDDHDKLLDLCNSLNVQYAEERQTRDANREVISDAIGLIQAKLRTLRAYVAKRLKNLKRNA